MAGPVKDRRPIVATAVTAYRDAFQALRVMPQLAIIIFLLSFVLECLQWPFDVPFSVPVWWMVWVFFGVPCWISFYRFVLLDEVTRGYKISLESAAFRRLLGWSIVFVAAIQLPTELIVLADPSELSWVAISLLWFIALILVVPYFVARTLIFFPAIAIDAADATFSSAYADMKGNVGRALAILGLTVFPLLVCQIALVLLLEPKEFTPIAVSAFFVDAVLQVLISALATTIAARFLQTVGRRVFGQS